MCHFKCLWQTDDPFSKSSGRSLFIEINVINYNLIRTLESLMALLSHAVSCILMMRNSHLLFVIIADSSRKNAVAL